MSCKVLMVQERGRHAENAMFRESENFRRAFARLGIESEVWGLGQPTFTRPFDEMVKPYDVVFVIENYDQQGWLPDFAALKGKTKVFWSIDSHCALGKHVFFAKRSKFDIHLNSTPGYLKNFEPYSGKCVWFPNAYPADLIDKRADITAKPHDVGFCGSMIGDRASWLSEVDRMVQVKRDVFVLGEEMVRCMQTYKVSLNRTIANDINYRIFETLGVGTALLTNNPPDLDRLFDDSKHLMTYSSTDDLKAKLRYLLDNDSVRESMALAGYQHVRENHTYDIRARELATLLGILPAE